MRAEKAGGKDIMKVKRILALAGVVLLVGLYLSTLVFALTDHSATRDLLRASVAATILVPVMLYAYMLVYRILSGRKDK